MAGTPSHWGDEEPMQHGHLENPGLGRIHRPQAKVRAARDELRPLFAALTLHLGDGMICLPVELATAAVEKSKGSEYFVTPTA